MNINKIYYFINEILYSYINEGIKPKHLLKYLNTNEKNFEYIYNRIYRKLNMEEVQFESDILKECLIDSIKDKVYMLNDLCEK